MTDQVTKSVQQKAATIEEISYDYVAPNLAKLFASRDGKQPDGVYAADSIGITVFSTNCNIQKD